MKNINVLTNEELSEIKTLLHNISVSNSSMLTHIKKYDRGSIETLESTWMYDIINDNQRKIEQIYSKLKK